MAFQIWLPLGGVALEKKNSRTEAWENIFDASPGHDARRQLITRIGGDSPLRLILFILCERNKKKWDYKRERSKEKIFNKKREKTIKKKNNNQADLANRVSVWQSNFDFSEKKTLYLDFNETLTKNI